MQRICFVCTGNICRSPMVEFLFRDLAQRAGLGGAFSVASAAVSDEECGNPVYPPARRILAAHGIDCRGKTARQLRPQDAEAFDLFVGMDDSNLRGMRRILGPAAQGRIHLLLEYADRPGQEVADPWYTGDFAAAWADISAGCAGLLRALSPTR